MTPALYGTWAALIPPVIAIGLALITKEVYSSLFVGIVVGALLYAGGNPIVAIEHFFAILHEEVSGNLGIVIFLIILGTIVALMIRAGGSKAYGDWASSAIKGKSGALIATGLLGIVLGVDDYFNNLTVGNVMRPVTDTHKVSRAKLAYMCDAVAAPVCIMMPISSWAAAVSGIIDGYDGFTLFVQAIPYNFYAILTLIMVFLTAALNIDFGPMKKHEDNAANGDLYTTEERPYANAAEMKFNPNGKVIDLILPVIVLIVFCVIGLIYTGGFFDGGVTLQEAFANCSAPDGLSMGSFVALIIIMVFFLIRKAFSFNEMMECLPEGFKLMVPATLILT
ncbi:MAG: Na+/H+ antiporter NhaC family protein, partial [Oscillospiraceae bacterium]|nr:Na+/H+ antiporter NhaC family protein [Oscillospiraceae bacterium]